MDLCKIRKVSLGEYVYYVVGTEPAMSEARKLFIYKLSVFISDSSSISI